MARRTTTRTDDRARPGQEQLLLLAGQGDVDAFASLYDELAPRVFGLVTRLVRDPAAAEAVTAEAFAEVWRRAPSYDPTTSSAAAWVVSLAHRLATRARRQADPAGDRAPASCAVETRLLAAGLSRVQVDALREAWADGLDHQRIDARLASEDPVTQVLTDGLRALAGTGPRR